MSSIRPRVLQRPVSSNYPVQAYSMLGWKPLRCLESSGSRRRRESRSPSPKHFQGVYSLSPQAHRTQYSRIHKTMDVKYSTSSRTRLHRPSMQLLQGYVQKHLLSPQQAGVESGCGSCPVASSTMLANTRELKDLFDVTNVVRFSSDYLSWQPSTSNHGESCFRG